VKHFTKEYQWLFLNKKKLRCNICSKVNHNLTKHQGTHGSKGWINGYIISVDDNVGEQQTS